MIYISSETKAMTKEQKLDDVVDDRRLPGWENYSINKWIAISMGQLGMDDYSRNFLRELLSEHGYTGYSPEILFGIYDFLAPDSEEALVHGIKAYEFSGHDIEQVAQLKNPGRLVSYLIDVTDEIETLASLQEKMFYVSEIRSHKKTNADPPIVKLGLEINERLAHIDLFNSEQRESLGFEKLSKLYGMRRDALERAVLAQQLLTGDSEETLGILAMYNSLTGTADIRGLDFDVIDSFMRKKLELDKPSKDGEVPDSLKADAYYEDQRSFWGFINPEQEWKMRHFGRQKKTWEQNQADKEQSKEEREKLDRDYRKMIEDPWAFYSEQLALLGLTKEMSHPEARRGFIKKIREHSSAFNTIFNPNPEYKASQEKAGKILSAWEIVSVLYKAREQAEHQLLS